MKRKGKLIVILFFLGISSFSSFGQIQREQDYFELARLFGEDVQLRKSNKISHLDSRSTYSRSPFSHLRILTLSKNSNVNTSINKVFILVNSSIYNLLPDKIKRYAYDIYYAYGCEVVMSVVSGGDHTDIKKLIVSNKTNLNGVVFIGDIPTAWFEIANDHNQYGYDSWACDLYYMDINGIWADDNGNDIYDSHTGNVQPEIFTGRISTANMGILLSENAGLEKYLDKNHKFWIGNSPVNRKFGLSYTDRDWASFSYFKTEIQYLYGNSNYDHITFGDAAFGKTDYLNRLNDNRYEFVQLACHASPSYLAMSGGGIYSSEIFNLGTEAIGYNLFCCSAGDWTGISPSSTQGFLAGSYIYNANNSSLVVVGSTKTGSMLQFPYFYTPLGQGKSIGESLAQWWVNAFGGTHTESIVSWHYGMSVIGDPLINFHYCTNDRCLNQITLNSFDASNTASHRHIIAKNKIVTNNYVIPSGRHVMFNAKNIELNPGFECQLGSSFEIVNEGCAPNCQ